MVKLDFFFFENGEWRNWNFFFDLSYVCLYYILTTSAYRSQLSMCSVKCLRSILRIKDCISMEYIPCKGYVAKVHSSTLSCSFVVFVLFNASPPVQFGNPYTLLKGYQSNLSRPPKWGWPHRPYAWRFIDSFLTTPTQKNKIQKHNTFSNQWDALFWEESARETLLRKKIILPFGGVLIALRLPSWQTNVFVIPKSVDSHCVRVAWSIGKQSRNKHKPAL